MHRCGPPNSLVGDIRAAAYIRQDGRAYQVEEANDAAHRPMSLHGRGAKVSSAETIVRIAERFNEASARRDVTREVRGKMMDPFRPVPD